LDESDEKIAGGALRLKGSKGGMIPPENPFPGAIPKNDGLGCRESVKL